MLSGTDPGGTTPRGRRLAWVFPTRESVWDGMSPDLFEASAAFRSAMEACDRYVRARLGWSLLDAMYDPPDGFSLRSSEEHVECALTAVQVGIVDVLRVAGAPAPALVLGRCGALFAGAYGAGAIDRDAAIELACRVSVVVRQGIGLGKMISVSVDRTAAQRVADACTVPLWLLSDSALGVTLMGCRNEDVGRVEDHLEGLGVEFVTRRSRFCFHSPLCEGWAPEFLRPLPGVAPDGARSPIVSSVDGHPVGDAPVDNAFFLREATRPTWLAQAIGTSMERGQAEFLVIGPNDTVSPMVREVAAARGVEVVCRPTGLLDRPGVPVLQETLDRLREAGYLVGGAAGRVEET